MEGQSSRNNNNNNNPNIPMPLILPNFCENSSSNDVPHHHVPEEDQKPQILMAAGAGRSWNQTIPWWVQVQPQETSQNYVKFLAESSAFLQRTTPEDMLESLPSPVSDSYPVSVSGVSDFQVDMSYNYPGQACGSKSAEMDAWKLRSLMQHGEDLESNFPSMQHQIHAQNHTSWTQNSNGDGYNNNVSRVGIPSPRVASSGFLPQPHSSVSRQKTYTTDRQRRMRISERLNALQELLPHSAEGCQASVLDDVIDHVKYLQLQIKDLCKSRLKGESPTKPIIFREGYGHYFCDQQMLTEPLEEMMAKLLELNTVEAIQLLEMKGLLIMSNELTEGLV